MLKKDYVLTAIVNAFDEGKTLTEVHEWLGVNETVLMAIDEVRTTGKKWGHALSSFDIIDFYKNGLTFSEVSWIKGVTKEAIRLTLDNVIPDTKEQAKEESRENRKQYKDIIVYEMVVVEADTTSVEEAIAKTGYSKVGFRRLYREAVAWKESQTATGNPAVNDNEVLQVAGVDGAEADIQETEYTTPVH